MLIGVINGALDLFDQTMDMSMRSSAREDTSSRMHQERVYESGGQRVTERVERVQESAPRKTERREEQVVDDDDLDRAIEDAVDRLGKVLAARALRDSVGQVRTEAFRRETVGTTTPPAAAHRPATGEAGATTERVQEYERTDVR
jgi:hypothetical protein